jgi:hypothetical protein
VFDRDVTFAGPSVRSLSEVLPMVDRSPVLV